jgi:hypothetical protein
MLIHTRNQGVPKGRWGARKDGRDPGVKRTVYHPRAE